MYNHYQEQGVENYYKNHGNDYSNPHFTNIAYIFPKVLKAIVIGKQASILDLACGSGEITRLLIDHGYSAERIVGMDPYTKQSYESNTPCKCIGKSFSNLVAGDLSEERYDVVVCSYAVHLIEPESLFGFMLEMSTITSQFVVLTHMRKFEVKHYMWRTEQEIYFPQEKIKVMNMVRVEI